MKKTNVGLPNISQILTHGENGGREGISKNNISHLKNRSRERENEFTKFASFGAIAQKSVSFESRPNSHSVINNNPHHNVATPCFRDSQTKQTNPRKANYSGKTRWTTYYPLGGKPWLTLRNSIPALSYSGCQADFNCSVLSRPREMKINMLLAFQIELVKQLQKTFSYTVCF